MWRFFVICDFLLIFEDLVVFGLSTGLVYEGFFLANIDSNNYILVTDCKLWVQNSPFRGLVYRGIFFRVSSFTKVWLYSHNYHDDSV